MTSLIRGIHVDELRKSDPVTAPKVTLLQAEKPYIDEEVHWMVNQVARAMQTNMDEIEVADVSIASFKVLEHVSNDPNDKRFSPVDQFPTLWDQIQATDIMLVATSEYCGYPSPSMSRLIRRLDERQQELKKDNESARLFKRGLFGVLVFGGYQVDTTAMSLARTFNRFGLTLVGDGIICWDRTMGNVYKSNVLANQLDRLAHQFTDLCPAVCR